MAFDFFSQPQGPNIDINLYPNAASAGINAGNAQKTPLQQVQQGISTGLQTIGQFQQIQDNALTLEIKQNQVDQLPVINEMREEQLKAQQTANQINDLKLQIDTETQSQALEAQKEALLNQAAKAKSERELRNRKDQFTKTFASLDPLAQKNLIMSGEYSDVFAASPNTFSQAVQIVSPYMTPEERSTFGALSKKASTAQAIEQEAAKRQETFRQVQQGLNDDFYITQAADAANLLPEDVPYKVRRVPSGFYEDTAEGLIEVPGFRPEDAGGREDYIIGNKIVARGVPKETTQLMNKYKNERAWQDGTYRQRALSAIDREVSRTESVKAAREQTGGAAYAPEKTATPSSEELYGPVKPNPAAVGNVNQVIIRTPSGEINLAENKAVYNNVQKALGLPTKYFEQIKPDVKEILSIAEQGPQPETAKLGDTDSLSAAIDRVSTFSAGAAYDTNPTVQARYTPQMVEEHNKQVQQFTKALSGPNGGLKLLSLEALYSPKGIKGQDISQMIEVGTPKELYIIRNAATYRDTMNRIITAYQEHIRSTKIAMLKSASIQPALLQQLSQPRR